MAKSLVADTILGHSTDPEVTLNAMVLAAAQMTALKTRSTNIPAPGNQKIDDAGEIGGGLDAGEFPTEQRNGFATPPTWDHVNTVDAGNFVKELRRILGAADPVPAGASIIEAGIAFQHPLSMLSNNTAAGLQLPSSTWAYSNNGMDYLLGGVLGNTVNVTQNGAADPQFTIGYVGSGLYKRIRDISGPAFGVMAQPVAQPKMKGPLTELEFTDAGGTTMPSAVRRIINLSVTYNSAIDTGRQLMGASMIDPNDDTKGWYLDEMLHGNRVAGATMRIFGDNTMREFANDLNNTTITGFKMRMRGDKIPGTVANNRYLVELNIGKCYFRNTRCVEDGGFFALDIDVFATAPASGFGVLSARAINGVATAIA